MFTQQRPDRRFVVVSGIVTLAGLATGACSGGTIDPQKVLDALKTGCGIAVPLATITTIINAAVGLTMQAIIDAICGAYKSTLASNKLGAPAVGSKVDFVVVIKDKEIPVQAEVVKKE